MRWFPLLTITFLALLAGSFALPGCATTGRAKRDLTLTHPQVIDLVTRRGGQIHTLRGEGSLTIETPEQSNSSSFDLALKKPDSLLLNLSGPFGIRGGSLLFSRTEFVFYNYQDNYAFIGKSDGSTLHAMFNLRMDFDEVIRAFTGDFFSSPADSLLSFSNDSLSYIFTYRDGVNTVEYRVDGEDYFVKSYRVIDSSGRATLTAIADEPEEVGPLVMPTLLRVIFPVERRSITVAYSDMEFDVPVRCSFTVPESADIFYR